MLKKINTPIGHWSLLIALSFVWGSSFILIKRGLETFSYEQVAALRLFIAFVFLAFLGRKHYKSVPKNKLWPLFLTGLIGNGIPAFLFTKSQTFLDSGLVGILNVLTPLCTLFIGLFFYHLKVKLVNYVGIAIGMIGTVYLLLPDIQEFNETTLLYSCLVLLATVCYGWSTNIIKANLHELNAVQITTVAFTFLGPWAGLYLFSTDFVEIMQTNPRAWASLGYISILAIIGTAISVIVFNQLIKMTGALFATSCTYIIPIVAILWGLLDQEQITTHHIGGFLIILGGVYLVNKRA
jgi:drug/metabolite transporter (DMT)-like permease